MADNENPEEAGISAIDFLDESFRNILRIANAVVKTLKRPQDADYAHQIIMKCEAFNTAKDVVVMGHNNKFFGCFVKILEWTALNQPETHYEKWYESEDESNKPLGEYHEYLKANTTYVSVKCLGGGNLLLYMALSTNPEEGWEENGLNIIQQRSLCRTLPENLYHPESIF